MPALQQEVTQQPPNPLDMVEEIVQANQWHFERAHDDELVVEMNGAWCRYRMYFLWQRDISALQFTCQFDMKVPEGREGATYELVGLVNNRLWFGHFDLCTEEKTPLFRYTSLYRGSHGPALEQLEDMVEIALTESERFYPSFQYVIWGGKTPDQAMTMAMLDPVGRA
jgi:hypothetical protein